MTETSEPTRSSQNETSEPTRSSQSETSLKKSKTRRARKAHKSQRLKSQLAFCLLIVCCCFVIILVSIAVAVFYYYLFKPKTDIAKVTHQTKLRRPVKLGPKKMSRARGEKVKVPPLLMLRYKVKRNYTEAVRECKRLPGNYSLAFPKSPEHEHQIHRDFHNMLLRDFTAYDRCEEGVLLGLRRNLKSDWVSRDGRRKVYSPFFARLFDHQLNPPPYHANWLCSVLEVNQYSTTFMQRECDKPLQCYICERDCSHGVCSYQFDHTNKPMEYDKLHDICVDKYKGSLATIPSKPIFFEVSRALKSKPSTCTSIAIGNWYGNHYEDTNEVPMQYRPTGIMFLPTENVYWSCIVIYPIGKLQWHVAQCEKKRCYLCLRDD